MDQHVSLANNMVSHSANNTTKNLAGKLASFADELDFGERDALKFGISVAAVTELENDFEVSQDAEKRARFSKYLRYLLEIQPFRARVPEYGLAYLGRPDFMTPALVAALQAEAASLRQKARINFEQYIVTVDTPDDSYLCEKLANSEQMYNLMSQHAGSCSHSFISSYIYYEEAGQRSSPHVDNAFTSLTAMIGIRHDYAFAEEQSSASIVYWPDKPPMEYRLRPGEVAIFFGVCAVHGRSPVRDGEVVQSLLLSFQPTMSIR